MGHPVFARFYARISPAMERGGMAEHRRRLLADLSGRVIEVGAGNGLNFPHYPAGVTEVLAVEPEPLLRELARRNAEQAPVPVRVVDGAAEQLPTADASVDAAVVSLLLCSVLDQHVALDEIRRVVKPGGQLRFLEHVQADSAAGVRLQRVLDATVWPRLFGGCHAGRDTVTAVRSAGFDIQRIDRCRFPDGPIPTPTSAHVLGVAVRRPEG